MPSVGTELLFQSKSAPLDQCPACGAAFMRCVKISSIFWRDQSAMMVHSIPAYLCDGCGEDFVSDETLAKLEMIKATLFDAPHTKVFVQVPVLDFGQVPLGDQ
jgi:YgiT-type zinc finger domain-containing protein